MRRRLAVGFSLIILAGAGYTLPPEKKGGSRKSGALGTKYGKGRSRMETVLVTQSNFPRVPSVQIYFLARLIQSAEKKTLFAAPADFSRST